MVSRSRKETIVNLLNANAQFWFFATVTLLRQVAFLVHQIQHRLRNRTAPRLNEDVIRTVWLYILYLAIWVGAGYELFREPSSTRWFALGMLAVAAGVVMRWIGLRTLGGFFASNIVIHQDHQLIRRGIYNVIRHPLHLALALELLGMAVIANELWIWAGWMAILAVLYQRQRREDAILRKTFGQTAIMYQEEVPAMNLLLGMWRKMSRLRAD